MATHNITINERGRPAPKDDLMFQQGDYVTFSAGNEPIILCLPVTVFEKERVEIAAGDTATIRVKPNAHGSFEYWSCNAADASGLNCSEITKKRKGDTGGGSVGGGG